ncbi:hypothetical protein QR680_005175 [Steinernema hermaphroditum]|uniref:Uncharacterized protein n=1 Tax=Steinernema hermaphroditum TaxID=289476 RepID=A0AA39HR38_9BILA|nr:hypothetical protein QR680_005175 [Steinernema hermaphroditum]
MIADSTSEEPQAKRFKQNSTDEDPFGISELFDQINRKDDERNDCRFAMQTDSNPFGSNELGTPVSARVLRSLLSNPFNAGER